MDIASVIAQMLRQTRSNQSQNNNPYNVVSSSAAVPTYPVNLYGTSAPSLQNQSPQGISPNLLPQPALEQAALQQGNIPMNPIIASIIKHFGLLNLIRNQGNQQMMAGTY